MNNKKSNRKVNTKTEDKSNITRRAALRKMGYAAFASSTMLLLLNNPTKVHAQSPTDEDPGGADDGWDWD